jgi:RimJ/RimL family protein N-acetyltransferase
MIETERLLLRPLRREDLPAFVAYRSDPAVAAFQSWDAAFSMTDAEALLAGMETVAFGAVGAWLQIAITDARTGALLGDCAVHVSAEPPRTAEVGVTLSRDHQGRGVAREALRALLAVLFGELGMHRVVAHADDRNAAVHRLLEGVGMRLEGRLVEADWFKGSWSTLRVYALLAREHAAER